MKKVLFSSACIALDLFSKLLALRLIPPFSSFSYPFGGIGLFHTGPISASLNLVTNTGVAWGLFPGHPSLLLWLRLGVISAFLFFLIANSRKSWPWLPSWLIISGALGNVIDMIFYGHVIDFIHVQFFGWSFPIFNIADSCITIGALLLILWPKEKVLPETRHDF